MFFLITIFPQETWARYDCWSSYCEDTYYPHRNYTKRYIPKDYIYRNNYYYFYPTSQEAYGHAVPHRDRERNRYIRSLEKYRDSGPKMYNYDTDIYNYMKL